MMHLFPNGWIHYLLGGLLIGAGVSLNFVFTGRVTGMSSVFSAGWSFVSQRAFFQQARFLATRYWRLLLALGVVLGALLWRSWLGPSADIATGLPWWRLLAGGLLIGFGARLSDGCTSGHGICGLASLSLSSLLAVIIFLATAIVSVHLLMSLGMR
ncbi:MAG: YeeE/YedE family protein [Gammaproteobacteria bacterium]|nr:YeeE/YedE family protein [Gammaproteobacteria bacterium]MDE2346479.1 YeeE/YedE family protein [Gammaproteobacteria bacterium]